MRGGPPGGPARPPQGRDHRRGRGAGEVRRVTGLHPGLAGAGGRHGRRLPRALAGWGKRSAAVVLAHYGHLDAIPDDVERGSPPCARRCGAPTGWPPPWPTERELVELFRTLATLRIDRACCPGVADLEWHGPTPAFEEVCRHLRAPALAERAAAIAT